MEKLTGLKRIKTAIFISGKGSNLKNLIRFSKIKKSPISINLVISNTNKAKGLKFAEKSYIKKNILEIMRVKKIKLICLAGFMKILSKNFIKKFDGKIINIHPSLLPKYKGLNTHDRAIKNNDKFSGCTVHYVNEKLDSGQIIIQKKVRITAKDTSASLAKKILKEEHKLYPAAILKIFN